MWDCVGMWVWEIPLFEWGEKNSHLRFTAQWAAKSCGCEKGMALGLGCLPQLVLDCIKDWAHEGTWLKMQRAWVADQITGWGWGTNWGQCVHHLRRGSCNSVDLLLDNDRRSLGPGPLGRSSRHPVAIGRLEPPQCPKQIHLSNNPKCNGRWLPRKISKLGHHFEGEMCGCFTCIV